MRRIVFRKRQRTKLHWELAKNMAWHLEWKQLFSWDFNRDGFPDLFPTAIGALSQLSCRILLIFTSCDCSWTLSNLHYLLSCNYDQVELFCLGLLTSFCLPSSGKIYFVGVQVCICIQNRKHFSRLSKSYTPLCRFKESLFFHRPL